MNKIAILTDDPGWHGCELSQAFARKEYISKYVSLTECQLNLNSQDFPVRMPGFQFDMPDAVFVRGVPGGSLQEVVFYLDILHALKITGIPVYNDGHAIERSVDKAMTSFLLQNAGLKTPPTWVLKNRSTALAIAEQELRNGFYVISKPLFGSQGEGVRRLEKLIDLFWLTSCNGIYYLQRFIESEGTGYSDIRVFVVSGKAVVAMRRIGKSWLNNVARGAKCETIKVDRELSDIAVKATQVLFMDYAGVDIIKDSEGSYTVVEVNSIPAWKGLERVSKIKIADILANDLIVRYLNDSQPELKLAAS